MTRAREEGGKRTPHASHTKHTPNFSWNSHFLLLFCGLKAVTDSKSKKEKKKEKVCIGLIWKKTKRLREEEEEKGFSPWNCRRRKE